MKILVADTSLRVKFIQGSKGSLVSMIWHEYKSTFGIDFFDKICKTLLCKVSIEYLLRLIWSFVVNMFKGYSVIQTISFCDMNQKI